MKTFWEKFNANIRFVNHLESSSGGFSVALSALLLLTATFEANATEPLLILFREKPPYSFVENGVQKGFLLDRTKRILSRARIESKFVVVPPKRIFQDIQLNAQPVCSFGWYKIPEREKYSRFSLSIHQDRPHVIIANAKSAEKLRRHSTIKRVMSDPSIVFAIVDGTSYGPELDAMIAAFPGRIDRALVPPVQVAKKVAGNRADFMFIDQDDYDYIKETDAEFRNSGMIRISYPDMPAGLKRYILCSQKVSEDLMLRIDAAIKLETPR
jgi:uncharacterized protein (TIGR02285 family)